MLDLGERVALYDDRRIDLTFRIWGATPKRHSAGFWPVILNYTINLNDSLQGGRDDA